MKEFLQNLIIQPFIKFLEWLGLTPWEFFSFLTIITGFFIFAPPSHLNKIGLIALRQNYLPIIGGTFVISSGFWLSLTASWLWERGRKKYQQRRLRNYRKEKLRSLTPKEKKILGYYVLHDTREQDLDISSGVVNQLEGEKYIIRSSPVSTYGYKFSYNIQPWVKEYLEKHPELVDLEAETTGD